MPLCEKKKVIRNKTFFYWLSKNQSRWFLIIDSILLHKTEDKAIGLLAVEEELGFGIGMMWKETHLNHSERWTRGKMSLEENEVDELSIVCDWFYLKCGGRRLNFFLLLNSAEGEIIDFDLFLVFVSCLSIVSCFLVKINGWRRREWQGWFLTALAIRLRHVLKLEQSGKKIRKHGHRK